MREAEIEGRIVQGRSGRILASFYRAAGDGKHPVVLLCHGFPGNDQFTDLAYQLQEDGYHVMTFHYSGSWGSDGDYSLSHGLEDTETLVDDLLCMDDETMDKDRLYIAGHSLGGFFAGNVFAKRKEIAGAVLISPANIVRMYREAVQDPASGAAFAEEITKDCLPLRGVSGKTMASDLEKMGDQYELSLAVPAFGTRPVLLIGGTRDTTTPMKLCFWPIQEAAGKTEESRLTTKVYDASHSYLNVRGQVREEVERFLDALSKE